MFVPSNGNSACDVRKRAGDRWEVVRKVRLQICRIYDIRYTMDMDFQVEFSYITLYKENYHGTTIPGQKF